MGSGWLVHLGTYCSAEGRERSFPSQPSLGYAHTVFFKYGKNEASPASIDFQASS